MTERITRLATALTAALLLPACSTQYNEIATPAVTSTSTSAQPTLTPPLTYAERYEKRLRENGAEITDEGLTVTLDRSSFKSGTSTFEPTKLDRIDRIANLMKERPRLQLVVTGHTDSHGATRANRRLSELRAASVRDLIVQRHNVDPARITVRGMGEAEPIADNATAEGRAQNRRVEVTLANDQGKFHSMLAQAPAQAP